MKNYFKVTKYALINFLLMIIGQLSGAGIYTILIKNNKLISDKFINFSLVTISAELTAFLLVWLFAKYYFKIQIPNIFSNSKSALKLIIPILIFIILNLLSYLQTFQKNGFQLKIVLVSLLVGLSIGLFEEFATRLTLIAYNQENNLITYNTGLIVLIGVVFSLYHSINAFEANIFSTLLQIMYAVGIGIFFAAVYLRTKNFISIMIAHGLIDGISLASNPNSQLSTGQSTPPLISWVIFGLITLYFIYVSIKYVNKNNTDKINRIWQ